MFAKKIAVDKPGTWSTRDKEILEQYKRKQTKKYTKDVSGEDILADLCSLAIAESVLEMDETELVPCSALIAFEKPVGLALEKTMFSNMMTSTSTETTLLYLIAYSKMRPGIL